MVTAEFMTVAPFAVALVMLLMWIISLGWTQVRIADASRESARMVARGESIESARSMAQRQAPDGATVRVTRDGALVSVTVQSRSRLPVPFFSAVGSRRMQSTSVAVQEQP